MDILKYLSDLNSLIVEGWEVEKISLYDEECIEGWRWTSPDGYEHVLMGDWDDLIPLPE